MKVVVLGGTGLVGAKLVGQIRKAGHEAVVAARSTDVDIETGRGLAEALEGADAVVDVSSPGHLDPAKMLLFFKRAAGHVLSAEHAANVPHHIVFSAIGAGRVSSGYFRAKNAQEALVATSDIPFTIVRSAPLFEYIYNLYEDRRGAAIVRVPPVRVQPVAADDAAAMLLGIATGTPANAVVELAGPVTYRLPDLAGQILTANEDNRTVLTDGNATLFGARLTGEALTGGADAHTAPTGFEGWLRRSLVPA